MNKKSSRGIVYEIKNDQKNSDVIIFLHGFALNKSIMNDFASFFFQHDFNVIIIELRGHGYSEKEKCEKNIYINECMTDVLEILEYEKIKKSIVIGHSLGAIIGSCLVSNYPEKFNKLIISAPLFRNPLKDQIINAGLIKIFILMMTYFNCILSRTINKKKYIELNNLPQKTKVLFFNGLSTCYPKSITLISDFIYSNNFNISSELKKIDIRTMIIGGKNDFLVNRKILNKIKKLIKNSILKVYKGNHCIIYKNNNIWKDIINFIYYNSNLILKTIKCVDKN